ncbi:hypothetical protein [Candidatus Nitrosocosmicus sp. T]
MHNQTQNNNHGENDLTPHDVISNASRFNKQFINKQLAGPVTVSVGKMLTVMGQQHNTIGILSNILGESHGDKELHDMHNSIFGGLVDGSGTGRKGMELEEVLAKITEFINQQNQEIQELIVKISQNIQHNENSVKSSSTK